MIQQTPPSPIVPSSVLVKTLAWRVVLTLFILSALGGPGAQLLQTLAVK